MNPPILSPALVVKKSLGGPAKEPRHRACNSLQAILAAALGMAAPGCSTPTTFQGGNALKDIYSAHVADLRIHYSNQTTLQDDIDAANGDATGEKRNRLINDFIFLIDNNYAFWETHTFHKKAFADFGADFTSATLSTLSGIVTGGGAQGAKSLLAFIASGVTTTKASFNQDVLQNQNLMAILAKCRALRAEKLIPLQHGMYLDTTTAPRPLANYSLEQGLVDLAAYYHAGTFVAALQDIIDKAGAAKTQSDKKVEKLKGITDGIPD